MNTQHHFGLVLLAALASMPCSGARSKDAIPVRESSATADLIIRGRIVQASFEAIPQQPGLINLASRWTYKIHVVQVMRGDEQSGMISVVGESDPAVREDKDFIFYLSRLANGTYYLSKLSTAQ